MAAPPASAIPERIGWIDAQDLESLGKEAQFLEGVAKDQIWFQHSGNNLVVSIIGTSDQLTVQDWYRGTQYRVEQFKTAAGEMLLASQVQNLVNAMAAFAPPAAGETTLSDDYAAQLAPTIAANWH